MANEQRLLARFGGLTVELSGWLPPLKPSDHLNCFLVSEGAPEIQIHVTQTAELEIPRQLPLLHESFGCCVYADGARRYLCYRAVENREFWFYAVLEYSEQTPDRLELRVLDHRCRFGISGILSCVMMESVLLRHGRAILHASCVDVDGQAILFSAPSGTGKSTQAALWERFRGAETVNGDKILLCRQNGREMACGLPYAGTSGICKNRSLPIRVIVMLEQGKENRITRLPAAAAVKALLGQMPVQAWSRPDVERAMSAAQRVAEQVPVCRFACLPDGSAVQCLENYLK